MQKKHKTSRMDFQVEPGYEDQLLGAEAPNWVELENDERAVLRKTNERRKIWQIQTDKLNVYVKRYESGGIVGWVKRVFRSSPAAVEFKNLQRARSAGVSCPDALAFGQKGWRGADGASILITAAVSPAKALDVYLQENPMDDELVKLLAELLGKGHRAGLAQADPHMGNFLVRVKSDGQRELVLTDLQKLHKIPPGGTCGLNRAGKQNLACCYAAVSYYLNSGQRERFLGEYLASLGLQNEGAVQHLHPEIEAIAWKLSVRRWAGRDRRSRRNNEYFGRIRPARNWRGSVLLTRPRPLPDSMDSGSKLTLEQWQKALEDPPGLFVGTKTETISDSQARLVVRRRLKVGELELDVYCKLFKQPAGLKQATAQRAYENGFALLTRKIPTVIPLAWLSKRIGPYTSESILITETVSGAICLEKLNSNEEEAATAIAELETELGRHGFVHSDLRPGNVLVKCNPNGLKQFLVSHCEKIQKADRFARHKLSRAGGRLGSRDQRTKKVRVRL